MNSDWDTARKKVGDTKGVLNLIGKGMPNTRGRRKVGYPFHLYARQRRGAVRGEAKIEARLLGKETVLVWQDRIVRRVNFLANAAGLGSRKRGNVIADLFGMDKNGAPVAGEVKITHRHPWYAVVECAEQVALLRADRKNLKAWLRKELKKDVRGAGSWGMVIAPRRYWKKQESVAAFELVDELRKSTKIRICCAGYADVALLDANPIELELVHGMLPGRR